MKLDTAIALIKNLRARAQAVSDLIELAKAEGRDGISDDELEQINAQYDVSHEAAVAAVRQAEDEGR